MLASLISYQNTILDKVQLLNEVQEYQCLKSEEDNVKCTITIDDNIDSVTYNGQPLIVEGEKYWLKEK